MFTLSEAFDDPSPLTSASTSGNPLSDPSPAGSGTVGFKGLGFRGLRV